MKDPTHVALTKCYFCGGDGNILLATRYRRDGSAVGGEKLAEAHGKVVNMDPCATCAGYMKQGIILITIDAAKSSPDWNKERLPNPHRAGGWFVVTEAGFDRIIDDPALRAWAHEHRWMFMEHEAAERVGLLDKATP